MLPTIEIDENGNLVTLYDDELDLQNVGKIINMRRASHVDFNEITQLWEVRSAKTGELVHVDKSYGKAVEWEIINFSPSGQFYELNY